MKIKEINKEKPFKIKDKSKELKKYIYDDEDIPLISKKKEIFSKLVVRRLDEIAKLDQKVNLNDLIYRYEGKTPDENFDTYDHALDLINKIGNGKIRVADVKYDQIRFKSNLGEIKKGNNKKRSKEQKKRTVQY